jgi:hypothetical protein
LAHNVRADSPLRVTIVIRCPKTGVEVPTGQVMDLEALHTLPKEKMALRCPVCGEVHDWSAEDALLTHCTEQEPPPTAS